MTLPTSGFATTTIRYEVHFYGNEVPRGVNFEIVPSMFHSGDPVLSVQRAEELMHGIETGLQAFADAMTQVDGISAVGVQKTFEGIVDAGDIIGS